MGVRIAQALNYPMVSQYMGMGDNQFLVTIKITQTRFSGMPVGDLLKRYPSVRLFLLKRGGEMFDNARSDFVLKMGDRLIVAGHLDDLKPLAKVFRKSTD